MRQYLSELRSFFRKGDMVLLLLCLVTAAFGCVIITSATSYMGTIRLIIIQIVAVLLGVGIYAVVSAVDLEFLSENRIFLVIFNTVLLALLIPFGTDNNTGNRSWLDIPLLPIDIQPAEFCKITFIVIMASTMASHQSKISSLFPSLFHMVFQLAMVFGLNMVLSKDMGVSLIFVFIFIGMAFAGGVSLWWFLLAGGAIAVGAPIVYPMLAEHQQNRLRILWDPTLDPQGINERFHAVRSLRSLTGGGFAGQGLFEGTRTQNGELFAQHTDFVFSAIGEELGFIGCGIVLILEFLIIARCIQVGIRSQDYMRRMVCFGAASALVFQVSINVGMCIGIAPVIGLTLPFISYGGSSMVSLFAMLGLVSGVHARPAPVSHERYLRPHR